MEMEKEFHRLDQAASWAAMYQRPVVQHGEGSDLCRVKFSKLYSNGKNSKKSAACLYRLCLVPPSETVIVSAVGCYRCCGNMVKGI